ncbi:hypothetical protein TP70_06230 [Staphylococcus microti]|uniref:RND efflux transporter n=1 Tax=Staphylococcus microti TaxID=569857 RepID=A0A0D6XQI5_9STAP|nr:hypothetical protein [Staphylococcus microti]KIX90715.1 hypothetical protein TP70_06230 [Staphylococcus microti]PNZ81722.1 hypothetical protein CD132_06010 [Staphylococcus microti]SUM56704.1 RND efflux transporter [Staphylococcus microti]
MTNKTKIYLSLIAISVCVALISILYYSHYTKQHTDIQTIEAHLTFPYQTTGIVQSDYYYPLTFQPQYGQIHEIHVKDGQYVTKETPLLTYYNPLKIPEINALSHLSTQIHTTEQAYEYLRDLVKLKSELYTTMQTPVQGIVRLHELVPSKKDSIILEIQSKTQHIITDLPEAIFVKLRDQKTVNLVQTTTHENVTGHITTILPPVSDSISSKQNTPYRAVIQTDKNYPIGSHFTIYLGHPEIQLPSDILLHKNYVVVHKNGKYVKRIINYDKINGQLIIKSGIFAGEKVVRNPNETALKIK